MTTLTFHQALTQAEAQARSTLDAALHERLSCAVSLVRDGRVFQTSAGLWQVDSSTTAGLTYSVNGTCSCEDYHFNKPRYCKHQLAMFLSQRVLSLMRQPAAPVVPELVEPWPDNDPEGEPAPSVETPPAPAAPAADPALPEMPLSLTLKGTLGGVDALLTVRGRDAAEFQANLAAVRGLLDAPASPPASQGPTGQGEGWCHPHSVQMRWNEGKQGKQGWWSHKTAQGWCKGH